MKIVPIPTDLMNDRIADAIINKARVVDAMVDKDIELELPIQPIKHYFDKCAAIVAGVPDE